MPADESENSRPPAVDLEAFSADEEFNAGWDGESTPTESTETAADTPPKEETTAVTEGSTEATEEPKAEETAIEKAERLAAAKFGKEETEETTPATEETQQAETKSAAPVVDFSVMDKDLAGFVKDALNKSPEAAKFREFYEEYPEVGLMMGTVVRAALSTLQNGMAVQLPEEVQKKLSKGDELSKKFDELNEKYTKQAEYLEDMRYFDALDRLRPGARQDTASKEFAEWLEKEASVGVRKLSKDADPESGAAVIDVYREYKAKKAAGKADAKTKLSPGLKQVAKPKTSAKPPVRDTSSDDFEAGWDLNPPKRWNR